MYELSLIFQVLSQQTVDVKFVSFQYFVVHSFFITISLQGSISKSFGAKYTRQSGLESLQRHHGGGETKCHSVQKEVQTI